MAGLAVLASHLLMPHGCDSADQGADQAQSPAPHSEAWKDQHDCSPQKVTFPGTSARDDFAACGELPWPTEHSDPVYGTFILLTSVCLCEPRLYFNEQSFE